MIKAAIGIVSLALIFSAVIASDAGALGLKVAPLEYRTSLEKDEKKRGFIDIANPISQRIKVTTSVQAFRQTDNNGSLQFFDDSQIKAGIVPELTTFVLEPREALRMFFTVDGAVLPEGDVYAAIFFTTEPAVVRVGVGQQVRVGTIISLVNHTPGERNAVVTDLQLPFMQLGSQIRGTYAIENTGNNTSGFYPKVEITAWIGGEERRQQGALVFGGNTRTNYFELDAGFGIKRISVKYAGSVRSAWVLLLPSWSVAVFVVLAVLAVVEIGLRGSLRIVGQNKQTSKNA